MCSYFFSSKIKMIALLLFFLPISVYANSDSVDLSKGEFVAKETSSKKRTKNSMPRVVDSWKPYWLMNRYFEMSNRYFFSMDVGCGFLYFSGVSADLQFHQLISVGATSTPRTNGEIQGKLGYNRTPVFDGTLSMKILNWMNLGLSYVHQGGVNVYTRAQFYGTIPVNGNRAFYEFSSLVSFDAILAKVYFYLPGSIIWKTIAYNMYLGGAVGPGWQSWVQNRVLRSTTGSSSPIVLKQKYSCNAVWMIDTGLKLRSILPNLPFAVHLGTKFIGWGQARSIGLISQQRDYVFTRRIGLYGLFRPFRVKFVYSFVPYMGVQWNF